LCGHLLGRVELKRFNKSLVNETKDSFEWIKKLVMSSKERTEEFDHGSD